MNFEIHGSEVQLRHLNVRTETHGEEEVTAIDLKLQWDTGNEVLAQFHPSLRTRLYSLPPPEQEPVPGLDPAPVVLQFPDLAPLHWKGAADGVTLAIHHALGEGEDIVLAQATADNFTLEPMEGGTVRVGLRVKAVCEDERILGRLPLLLHRHLPMSLMRVRENVDDGGDELFDTKAEEEAA